MLDGTSRMSMVGRGESTLSTMRGFAPGAGLVESVPKPMAHPPEPAPHPANKKSAARTAALFDVRISRNLRQGDDVEVEHTGVGARQDDRVVGIEQIELLHALQ